MRIFALACAASLAGPAVAGAAGLCPRWSPAEQIGALDGALINEASGIEASQRFPGRLYHNNDSGDALRVYVTDGAGVGTRVLNLKGPRPRDIEDMSLGPCGRDTCLYLGDIGDNPASRDEVAFVVLRETARSEAMRTPLRTVRARYPDGAHNAEAFAVHPNGDLFVVTKPADARMARRDPAMVFRMTAAQLRGAGPVVFEKLGEIDLARLAPDGAVADDIVTGMDITADGGRVALLTYGAVFELAVDLAKGLPTAWTRGVNYQVVRFKPLRQQEAVAWLPDASGLLIDTEANHAATAPLIRLRCEGGR